MTRTGITRIHSRIGTTPGKHACFARPLCRRVIILSWGITEITVRTADTGDSSLLIPSRERHLSYTGHGHTGKDSSTWWIDPKGPFHLGFFGLLPFHLSCLPQSVLRSGTVPWTSKGTSRVGVPRPLSSGRILCLFD